MSGDWEWTQLDGYAGRVLLVGVAPTSAGQRLVAVFDSEADALAPDAESRASAILGESLLTEAQLRMAARNRQTASAKRA